MHWVAVYLDKVRVVNRLLLNLFKRTQTCKQLESGFFTNTPSYPFCCVSVILELSVMTILRYMHLKMIHKYTTFHLSISTLLIVTRQTQYLQRYKYANQKCQFCSYQSIRNDVTQMNAPLPVYQREIRQRKLQSFLLRWNIPEASNPDQHQTQGGRSGSRAWCCRPMHSLQYA